MKDWQPKLMEIDYLAHNGTTEEREYYSKFGLTQCVWDERYTNVLALRSDIERMFFNEYANRMIGIETMELWHFRVQATLDRISPGYDRAFGQYGKWAERMINDIVPTMRHTVEDTIHDTTADTTDTMASRTTHTENENSSDLSQTNGSTATSTNLDTVTETPDNAINYNDIGEGGYASTVSKNSSENHTTDTVGSVSTDKAKGDTTDNNTVKATTNGTADRMRSLIELTETEPDLGVVEAVNANITKWKNLVNEFVREFEGLFLGIYFY